MIVQSLMTRVQSLIMIHMITHDPRDRWTGFHSWVSEGWISIPEQARIPFLSEQGAEWDVVWWHKYPRASCSLADNRSSPNRSRLLYPQSLASLFWDGRGRISEGSFAFQTARVCFHSCFHPCFHSYPHSTPIPIPSLFFSLQDIPFLFSFLFSFQASRQRPASIPLANNHNR